jgi:hypothetical protein
MGSILKIVENGKNWYPKLEQFFLLKAPGGYQWLIMAHIKKDIEAGTGSQESFAGFVKEKLRSTPLFAA